MDFKNILSVWYLQNKRDLPWRDTSDPYRIWVSEVILQQTRVMQGMGYYNRFVNTFPTVYHLAQAHEDEVLKLWQGLGYYTRARNLHKGAKIIVSDYGGEIPESYEDLMKIKGIGAYSAGAIASFAFKMAVPAIDGNVYRVIARIFGVFTSPETASGKREFFKLVEDLMDKNSPDSFNQALLDFGALQCVPRSPKCNICPFSMHCYAFRNNVIDSLPVKAKKIIPRDRFFTYLLVKYKGFSFIKKRNSNDIWHSLYEFPLIETPSLPDEAKLSNLPEWINFFKGTEVKISYVSPVVKHQLSHQTIYTRFVIVDIDVLTRSIERKYLKVLTSKVDDFSVPKLIDNFLVAEPAAKYFLNSPQ